VVDGLSFGREDGFFPALDPRSLGGVVLVGAGEERYLEELSRLAQTLGLEVLGWMEQARRDNAGYVGSGKRAELKELVRELGAGLVVADDELTAAQARVLERDADSPVIDRTELIIRIFHEHARDAPSKLQVELAELQYLLPRVRGMWRHLERLGGGSAGSAGSSGSSASGGRATRGPGEQQLEYDRRQVRTRMERLKRRLAEEKSSRAVRRSRLNAAETPSVALVGYTNAGKTTILNALSGAGRSTKDRLFETLETTTRLVEPRGAPSASANGTSRNGAGDEEGAHRPAFTVTDTVGFIRKLPTQLVESFSSTLEAAASADVLLICADAASPRLKEELDTVKQTLEETLADSHNPSIHIIQVLNKKDLLSDLELAKLEREHPEAVFVDREEGYERLLERIYEEISAMRSRMEVLIPHSEYAEVARLYGAANIHSREERTGGVLLDVSVPRSMVERYSRYRAGS
jgi:GTPase